MIYFNDVEAIETFIEEIEEKISEYETDKKEERRFIKNPLSKIGKKKWYLPLAAGIATAIGIGVFGVVNGLEAFLSCLYIYPGFCIPIAFLAEAGSLLNKKYNNAVKDMEGVNSVLEYLNEELTVQKEKLSDLKNKESTIINYERDSDRRREYINTNCDELYMEGYDKASAYLEGPSLRLIKK